jgi:hypothetical protein
MINSIVISFGAFNPMRHIRMWLLAACLALLTLTASAQTLNPRGGSISPVDDSNAFVHKTSNDNINFNYSTLISESLTNKSPMTAPNPNAMVFVTRNVTQSTAYHAEPYGLYYGQNKWRVFNQNTANAMIAGVGFNVQVMGKGDTVFTHTVTAANTIAHTTVINHPLLNSNPGALIIVTPTWDGGVYNNNEIGVYYFAPSWRIFNQKTSSPMPVGATFNIQVLEDSSTGFTHLATGGNIVSTSKTEIDNIWLNNNLNAQFLVTQNWSLSNTYNNKPIGVEYDNASNKWRIINIDGAAMPVGAGFNILVTHTGDVFGDGVLFNGGFEVPGISKTKPIKWNVANVGSGSKRVWNKYAPKSPLDKEVAVVGECAYLLKGVAGEGRKLVQTITIPLVISDNHVIDLIGLAKGVNVTGAKIKGLVKLSNGSTVSYNIPGSSLNGTYDWQNITGLVQFPASTPPVKLTLTISIGSGMLYLDDLSSAVYAAP